MKTNCLSLMTSYKPGPSPYSSLFVVSLMLALLVAFLPATSVFAAPASNHDLEGDWANKIRNVRVQNLFYTQVRLFPADFEDSSDLAQAYELLHKYGFALRQANAIITTRAGFDINGNVIDEKQAMQSVKDLAENLRIMRGIQMKIEEQGYELHRLR